MENLQCVGIEPDALLDVAPLLDASECDLGEDAESVLKESCECGLSSLHDCLFQVWRVKESYYHLHDRCADVFLQLLVFWVLRTDLSRT